MPTLMLTALELRFPLPPATPHAALALTDSVQLASQAEGEALSKHTDSCAPLLPAVELELKWAVESAYQFLPEHSVLVTGSSNSIKCGDRASYSTPSAELECAQEGLPEAAILWGI